MKTLILVRHAKSSWKDPRVEDHDRTLNKRGERDAAFMAKVLKKKKGGIDVLVSSTAVRALTTANQFAKELGFKKDEVLQENELYLAGMDEMVEFIQQLADGYHTVAIFGHNPGITWLANALSAAAIENIPTCGICAIQFDIESWKEVAAGKGKLLYFEYPKLYFKDSED